MTARTSAIAFSATVATAASAAIASQKLFDILTAKSSTPEELFIAQANAQASHQEAVTALNNELTASLFEYDYKIDCYAEKFNLEPKVLKDFISKCADVFHFNRLAPAFFWHQAFNEGVIFDLKDGKFVPNADLAKILYSTDAELTYKVYLLYVEMCDLFDSALTAYPRFNHATLLNAEPAVVSTATMH